MENSTRPLSFRAEPAPALSAWAPTDQTTQAQTGSGKFQRLCVFFMATEVAFAKGVPEGRYFRDLILPSTEQIISYHIVVKVPEHNQLVAVA
ncbi:hypothetical protein BKP64_15585 [Marinobacter salinus]|uniref:Uncharacterized protein n=1 Tax=Marinobacter salinus TaxID=1874317 RepID=A0A1D9GPM9_9GAMM|nr:hypothetical protein BKP64_15585 [Marinobacter salinus]